MKAKNGILLLLTMLSLALATPGNSQSTLPAAGYHLLAQLEPQDTTKFDNAVRTAENFTGVHVDTVNNVDDILNEGMYLVKNHPVKGQRGVDCQSNG